jgi:hypothetical protein
LRARGVFPGACTTCGSGGACARHPQRTGGARQACHSKNGANWARGRGDVGEGVTLVHSERDD